jgi:hypothetical protein
MLTAFVRGTSCARNRPDTRMIEVVIAGIIVGYASCKVHFLRDVGCGFKDL